MSAPIPPVAITQPCSVIVDDVLYVYTADAFQALPLTLGGKWSTLPSGVSVTGASCVGGSSEVGGSTDVLWVVGGTTNGSDTSYSGLQAYSFTNQSWQTIEPQVAVTAGRINHAVAFLNSSASLLVYAGGQNGSTLPSSDTFVVSTTPPYQVESFTSMGNVPVAAPILLPWTTDSAVTVGGAATNQLVFTFVDGTGWQELSTTLAAPLNLSPSVQSAIVQGADGSKVLQIFDFSQSPVNVTQIVLEDAGGAPAPAGQTIGAATPSRKRKRQLTLTSWPAYNSSNAPAQTRQACSLAQGADGLLVVSGGNNKEPIVMFNQNSNSWLDTEQFFGISPQKPLHSHHHTITTTSSSKTSTHRHTTVTTSMSSSTLTSTSATPTASHTIAAPSGGLSNHTKTILEAVLGSVLGALVLLLLIVLLCWCRRNRRKSRASAYDDEKYRMSFADRGDPNMKEAGGSIPYLDGAQSRSSLAIITGRSVGHRTVPSDSSTTHLVKKNGVWHNEPVEMEVIKERNSSPAVSWDTKRPTAAPNGSTRSNSSGLMPAPKHTSGWSRYFSGGGADTANGPPGSSKASTIGRQSTTSVHDCNSHGPTRLPPLQFGQEFDGERISNVMSGSPRFSHASTDFTRPQTAAVERPGTSGSFGSTMAPSTLNETIFSHEMGDETSAWTPVTRSDWTSPGYRNTTTSSIYDQRASDLNPFQSKTIQHQALAPQVAIVQGSTVNGQTRASNLTIWPRASIIPVKPEAATNGSGLDTVAESQDFPQTQSKHDELQQQLNTSKTPAATTDMSWLNLGVSARG